MKLYAGYILVDEVGTRIKGATPIVLAADNHDQAMGKFLKEARVRYPFDNWCNHLVDCFEVSMSIIKMVYLSNLEEINDNQ
jgi:hypothetical protein